MKQVSYALTFLTIIVSIFLIAFAPDWLSIVFGVSMTAIILLGSIFCILPVISIYGGLQRGAAQVVRNREGRTSGASNSVFRMERVFRQRTLDQLFDEYKTRVSSTETKDVLFPDVEEYINDDMIGIRCWSGIATQIPGTLTGLGILGTFIGLVTGISEIGFSSVDATIDSIQTLLAGINTAFYTSIAGIILSILFNLVYRFTWGCMMRELGIFQTLFHQKIVPGKDEQRSNLQNAQMEKILQKLERLPKSQGFSVSSVGATGRSGDRAGMEQVLMPQIIEGIRNGEFTFFLQGKYDLNSLRVIGAEALVRWNHPKLGVVGPSVFIPVLEMNGYITKLDEYIWRSVFALVRRWMDEGRPYLPIAVNITRTDILAMDVSQFFIEMLEEYEVPPRLIQVEIAKNAFSEVHELAAQTADSLRKRGFQVLLDGFDGDLFSIGAGHFPVDEMKLDLRKFQDETTFPGAMQEIFRQNERLPHGISVEGLETMNQVSVLRKCGCTCGQGYYFGKPVTIEEFEAVVDGQV